MKQFFKDLDKEFEAPKYSQDFYNLTVTKIQKWVSLTEHI